MAEDGGTPLLLDIAEVQAEEAVAGHTGHIKQRLMGASSSAGSRELSHSLSFGINLAVLTNMAQFMGWKAAAKPKSIGFRQRLLPLLLVVMSTPLLMADLTRHVLLDAGLWKGGSMYRHDCDHDDMRCLTAIGWLFTIIFTWTGFVLFITGVVLGSGVLDNVAAAWRDLRAGRRVRRMVCEGDVCRYV